MKHHTVKIGLAVFRVLICYNNRINLKIFDRIKLCSFIPFPTIRFQNALSYSCFQHGLPGIFIPISEVGEPQECREELSEAIEKSLTKLSVECSELNDKRVFLTKGNCQGTDKGGRGIGKVLGCGVFN